MTLFFGTIAAAALSIVCTAPRAIDGDTLHCRNLGPVRIVGIDAPEMPGHCRAGRVCTPGDGEASKAALAAMLARGAVICTPSGRDGYGRLLARCSVRRRDLGCAQIAAGLAVRRYGRIDCRR